jgi:WD40 repeat protein
MADGSDLAAPGTRAVLFGSPLHVADSRLTDLPSVAATLDDVAAALRDICGMDRERVHRVPADAAPSHVIAAVEQAVEEATGPVLFHYVGHGLVGPEDELYLATHGTTHPAQVAHAVPYRTVRNLLSGAAGGSLVVLDCCYSGMARAPSSQHANGSPFVVTRPVGSCLLSAGTWLELAFAPPGAEHTLYSGRLLELLRDGDPAGSPWLTIDGLATALEQTFADGPTHPHRQTDGAIGSLRLTRNRAYPDPTDAWTEPPADVPCPYPGMEPFRATDAGHFFGRDQLTRRLVDVVLGEEDDGPSVVVGSSGVGKTSLLTAGLLAGLERRRAVGEPAPRSLFLSAPGDHPLAALTGLWARYTGHSPTAVRAELERGRLPQPPPGRERCGLLVVDQFEEVFTRCSDRAERDAFIHVLTDSGADGARPCVVLGLRADHYGAALAHPALATALGERQIAVTPMDDTALRAAIEEPAQAVALVLEPGLTDRLLHDLRQEHTAPAPDTAALPFLAHALRETWRRRSGTTLTLAGYQATGGIWQAVTATTEKLYADLDPVGRGVLRSLLLRLVHVVEGARDGAVVRRRVSAESLLDGLPDERRALAARIRDRLAAERLITVDTTGVQIAHEALLRSWGRLRTWIDEDRPRLRSVQRLEQEAERWLRSGKDTAYLLTGSRLAAAQERQQDEAADDHRLPLHVRDFIHASTLAAARSHRRRRSLRRAATGAVALILAAAGYAVDQSIEANDARAQADANLRTATIRTLVAEAENLRASQPQLSLKLALAAQRLRPSAEARHALVDTLATARFSGSAARDGRADSSELGPDGRIEAAVVRESIVLNELTDAARPQRLARIDNGCVPDADGLALDRTARSLAGACQDGSIALWSLKDRHDPRRTGTIRLDGVPGLPDGVAFSPDGKLLAAVGWGGTAENSGRSLALWDIRDPAAPRRLAVRNGVYDNSAVAFAPDGRTLISSTERVAGRGEPTDSTSITHRSGATLWDIADPSKPRRLKRLEGVDETLAVSPDGRLLATHTNEYVTLWDLSEPASPKARVQWTAHKDSLTALAFNHDGTRLATASWDRSVGIWDVRDTGRPRRLLSQRGHEDRPVALAFSANGRTLTSAGDESVMRWDLTGRGVPSVIATLPGQGAIAAADFTPDGRTLVTGGYDEQVTLWDLKDPDRPRIRATAQVGAFLNDLAVNFDGSTLATADRSGAILLWDIENPDRPRKAATVQRSKSQEHHLEFAPDTRMLLANGAENLFSDGWATMWDVSDRAHPRKRGTARNVDPGSPAHFSPDGRRISLPGQIRTYLQTIGNGTQAKLVKDAGNNFGFSPDPHLAATTDSDGLLLLDIRDPGRAKRVGHVPGTGDDRTGPVFHPAGDVLAVDTFGGDVLLYDVQSPAQAHLTATLSRPLERLSFLAFSPNGRYTVTYAAGGSTLVWDLGTLPAIASGPVARACAIAGGGLDEEEWAEHVPGFGYRDACQ